jgi:hypothetical protein
MSMAANGQSLEERLVKVLQFAVTAGTLELKQHLGKNGTSGPSDDSGKKNGKLTIAFLLLSLSPRRLLAMMGSFYLRRRRVIDCVI